MRLVSRVLAPLRYRLSARSLFVDLHTKPQDTILLVGSRRSGTTWLSEVINYDNDFRTIFEPFHPTHSSWAQSSHPEWAKYVEPDYPDAVLAEKCRSLWAGRLRDPWVDKHNTKRLATRRMIKCVEATNLLPWITQMWPGLKTVYLVRHPFATSESQLEVSFRDDGLTDFSTLRLRPRLVEGVLETLENSDRARDLIDNATEPFEQHVVRWCLENRIPLAMLTSSNTHIVLYERLVVDLEGELTRLGNHLGCTFGDRALEAAKRPSRTDFRDRARDNLGKLSPHDFLAQWQQRVTEDDIDAGVEVLRAFELDHLYGRGPMPLMDDPDSWRPGSGTTVPESVPCGG